MAKAQSKDLFSKLNELLECPLCLETCQDPKTLPCHHWLCTKCLDRLVETSTVRNKFCCPSCRLSISIPAGGVSEFPVAFFVNKLTEAVGMQRKIPSEHDKKLSCPEHKREFEMFCETCQNLVCVTCCLKNHKGHSKLHVEEVVDKHLGILKGSQKHFAKRLAEYEKFALEMQKRRIRSKAEADGQKQTSDNQAEKIIQLVKSSLTQIHQKIDDELSKVSEECDTIETSMNTKIAELSDSKNEIYTVTGSGNAANIIDVSMNKVLTYQLMLQEPEKERSIPSLKIAYGPPQASNITERNLFGELIFVTHKDTIEFHEDLPTDVAEIESINESAANVSHAKGAEGAEGGSPDKATDSGEEKDDYEDHKKALEITGIPEYKSENLVDLVTSIGDKCNVNIQPADIDICMRTKFKIKETKSIIVIFKHITMKEKLMKQFKKNKITAKQLDEKFPKENVYINEYLPLFKRKLLAQARKKRKQLKYKFVWTKNGNIFMRKNDHSSVIKINNENDFEKLVVTVDIL